MERQERLLAERYHTTGQFGSLDRVYRRNCGPTAITNLILTLLARRGETPDTAPPKIFIAVAALGRRRALYFNIDLLGRWGGTSDLLSGAYLRAALKRFGLGGARVHPRERLTGKRLEEALGRGSVLYVQLRRHPRYGDHHLLCYGTQTRLTPGKRETLLRLADGWSDSPVWLPLKGLRHAHFIEIEDQGGNSGG